MPVCRTATFLVGDSWWQLRGSGRTRRSPAQTSGRGGSPTFVFGGLNHQIEHHLFPSMAPANLRAARLIVPEYCCAHGIPYCEVGTVASYREVARYLGEVSEAARS